MSDAGASGASGAGAHAATRILGVDFFRGSLAEACDLASRGGLLTAPSGPGLSLDLIREPAYRAALASSDVVLTDSALMVLVWWLRSGRRMPRNSGLAFLRLWLGRDAMKRPGAVLWVAPSERESQRTREWLVAHGYPAEPADFYVAPASYGPGPIVDDALLALAERRRPEIIYLGIGGGVQERVGHGLRSRLSYRPTILCLGAAIAFLTGAQVRIPPVVDRLMLGWLWRVISDPVHYGLRYLRAFRLVWLVLRFGGDAPPLVASAPSSSGGAVA